MGTVQTLSIVGMIFTGIVAVGLPIGLMLFGTIRLKASPRSFLIGAAAFILSALVFEQILHTVVSMFFGEYLQSNILVYAIYGGLAAGIFEETGRFIAMKKFMKNDLTKENAIMYGIGHGGTESVIIVGLASVSNIIASFMINSGEMEKSLEALSDDMREATFNQISALWTNSSYVFFMGGIERALTIVLHICLSYLIYRAVKDNGIKLYILAIVIHACIDAITVICARFLPAYTLEFFIFVFVFVFGYFVRREYIKEQIPVFTNN